MRKIALDFAINYIVTYDINNIKAILFFKTYIKLKFKNIAI